MQGLSVRQTGADLKHCASSQESSWQMHAPGSRMRVLKSCSGGTVRAISLTPCRRKIVHAGVNIASRGCWTDREVPERWMIFWRRWMPFIQVPTLVGLPSWMPCRIMRSTLFRNFPADAWLPLWLDRCCCTKACNRPFQSLCSCWASRYCLAIENTMPNANPSVSMAVPP